MTWPKTWRFYYLVHSLQLPHRATDRSKLRLCLVVEDEIEQSLYLAAADKEYDEIATLISLVEEALLLFEEGLCWWSCNESDNDKSQNPPANSMSWSVSASADFSCLCNCFASCLSSRSGLLTCLAQIIFD